MRIAGGSPLKPQGMEPSSITYHFRRPEDIPPKTLEQIRHLIKEGSGVGTSWVTENLQNAFLIGYAEHEGIVVGTSTHKYPKEGYRKRIEAATGLDLSEYLERGYTAVKAEYRGSGIGGKLIRGLIERSSGKRVYVTIRMENVPPLKMTCKERMVLAARFMNERTGHELGVFTNQPPPRKMKPESCLEKKSSFDLDFEEVLSEKGFSTEEGSQGDREGPSPPSHLLSHVSDVTIKTEEGFE
jgi:GNAT superfamily N-acetyltransferase